MTTEEIHNLNIDNEDTEIIKSLLTVVHLSIHMETAAKKSSEVWDSKGQQWKN